MKCHLLALFLAIGIANVSWAQGRGGATGGFPGGMGQIGGGIQAGGMQGAQFGGQTGGMGATSGGFGTNAASGFGNAGGFGTGGFSNGATSSNFGSSAFGSTSSGLGSSAMGGSAMGGAGLSSQMGGLGGGQATFGNFSPFGNAAMGGMGMGGMNAMGMGMNRGMGMMGGMGMGMNGMGGRGGMNGMNQFGGNQSQNKSKMRAQVRVGFTPSPAMATARSAQIQTRLARIPSNVGTNGVQVVMDGRTAVLRGSVASQADDRMLQRLLSLEPGVSKVKSELTYPGKTAENVPAAQADTVPSPPQE